MVNCTFRGHYAKLGNQPAPLFSINFFHYSRSISFIILDQFLSLFSISFLHYSRSISFTILDQFLALFSINFFHYSRSVSCIILDQFLSLFSISFLHYSRSISSRFLYLLGKNHTSVSQLALSSGCRCAQASSACLRQ